MKKMLIASDCFIPRWDGIVRFMLEVIPRLTDNYEITIAAPDFGPFKKIPNVKIVQFPVVRVNFGDIEFSGFNSGKIKNLVNDSDIVFVQTIGPIGVGAICAAKKCKKPVIAYVHSIEWELATRSIKRMKWLANKFTRRVARRYYNMCDLLIVPSDEVSEKHKKNRITTKKTIVHLGTDTDKFKPTDDKQASKNKIGLNPNLNYIGFSGRIGREKDLITLYRAFRRVEKKHENLRLLIVGKGIKELHEMFSSDRNIILPGSVDNIVDYLQAMDMFVLPSLTETSSLATMEAMACGLPVITTPVGFVKEYVVEKENGLFFPFKNSLVLSMKMELLLKDQILGERLGKNGRKTIIDNFQWDHTVEKIKETLNLYSQY